MTADADDDDDTGSLFRARREHSQVKRSMNREASAQMLTEAGIKFVAKNSGAHLIVDDAKWDFWPGTGKFKHRVLPIEGRGVRNFIKHIKDPK